MRIAFTSCMDEEKHSRQRVWSVIQDQDPHVLMLLGDHIYMDWGLGATRDESKWREAIDRDPLTYLPRFAVDMHARYAKQWGVGRFRSLIRHVVSRRGPDALFITWDDHDFAWNNGYGGGPGLGLRFVKPALAWIVRRLFNQFAAVLRTPGAADDYPALPAFDYTALALGASPQLPAAVSAWLPQATAVAGIPIVLLDQRSHRTRLDEPAPTLLGAEQSALLLGAVRGGTGLLIVAGSSPMRHDHGQHEQGWRSPPDDHGTRREYPEYRAFLDAAQQAGRAVLYLGGDIHRSAYGGPVEPGSQIVQVLASGAARKLLGVGLFGLVTLPDAPAPLLDGELRIDLFRNHAIEVTRTLRLRGGRWHEPPPGTCTGHDGDGAHDPEDARAADGGGVDTNAALAGTR